MADACLLSDDICKSFGVGGVELSEPLDHQVSRCRCTHRRGSRPAIFLSSHVSSIEKVRVLIAQVWEQTVRVVGSVTANPLGFQGLNRRCVRQFFTNFSVFHFHQSRDPGDDAEYRSSAYCGNDPPCSSRNKKIQLWSRGYAVADAKCVYAQLSCEKWPRLRNGAKSGRKSTFVDASQRTKH